MSADIRDGKLDKIPAWERTADPRSNDPLINHQWCDFIPGKLVPIYEFVPAGSEYKVTAEELRQAWTTYIDSKGKKLTPTKQSIISIPGGINVKGDKKTVKSLNLDREVSTRKNKETGWKVRFELVNLENGNVAVVVQLTVGEDGLDRNRTLLMLHYPIEVTCDSFAVIDTTKYGCSTYETSGSIYRQEHDMFDVTRFFLDCPFLDFVNHPDNKVFISVDDGGSNDSEHIRIHVDNFYVPVLVDAKE